MSIFRSWQLLQFDSVPIVFIRITGTHNSSNEVFLGVIWVKAVAIDLEFQVFHLVHLEAPADLSLDPPDEANCIPYTEDQEQQN